MKCPVYTSKTIVLSCLFYGHNIINDSNPFPEKSKNAEHFQDFDLSVVAVVKYTISETKLVIILKITSFLILVLISDA